MPHFSNVHRDCVGAWARDIRLALATAEYVDSADFQFDSGVEFDTSATSFRRPSKEVHLVFVSGYTWKFNIEIRAIPNYM